MKFVNLKGQSEEIRRKVQDKLYEMGYSWSFSPKYSFLEKNILVWEWSIDDYSICHSSRKANDMINFNADIKEVSIQELLRMTGLEMLMAGMTITNDNNSSYFKFENGAIYIYIPSEDVKGKTTYGVNYFLTYDWKVYSPTITLKDADRNKVYELNGKKHVYIPSMDGWYRLSSNDWVKVDENLSVPVV